MANEKQTNELGEIISKCWKDDAFKKRFLSDPKAVLAEHKIELPQGTKVTVVENTDDHLFIALPPSPLGKKELSDDQLDAVAGGGKFSALDGMKKKVSYTTSQNAGSTCYKDCIAW
jgi:hypothetical protein